MYDEIYVMEKQNKLKEKELNLIWHPDLLQKHRQNKWICKLPLLRKLEMCQCS